MDRIEVGNALTEGRPIPESIKLYPRWNRAAVAYRLLDPGKQR